MSMGINLDSATATNGTFSAPIQVYDSLGAAHTLTVTFTETAANSWSYNITVPNSDLSSSTTTGGSEQHVHRHHHQRGHRHSDFR